MTFACILRAVKHVQNIREQYITGGVNASIRIGSSRLQSGSADCRRSLSDGRDGDFAESLAGDGEGRHWQLYGVVRGAGQGDLTSHRFNDGGAVTPFFERFAVLLPSDICVCGQGRGREKQLLAPSDRLRWTGVAPCPRYDVGQT
jgi:hypothetical protein